MIVKQAKDIEIVRCAICVGKRDIFGRIVQRIFTKTCRSLNTKVNLLVYSISEGESYSDRESDEKVFGASSQSHNPNVWIVDSGASSRITQRKELLTNYEEFDKPQKMRR